MNSTVDVSKLVEQAKADASATGAVKTASTKDSPAKTEADKAAEALFGVSDESVDRLIAELEGLAEKDDTDLANQVHSDVERGRHLKIAKLLAAVDVITGVGR